MNKEDAETFFNFCVASPLTVIVRDGNGALTRPDRVESNSVTRSVGGAPGRLLVNHPREP